MAKAIQGEPAEAVDLEVATGEIALRNQAVVGNFVEWLTFRANSTDEDQFALMASIIGEIMEADNVADALREKSSISAKEVLGETLILHGFEVREGKFEESDLPFYASLTVGRPGSDKTRNLTCGGMKVLVRLRKLDEIGEWPVAVKFVGKETAKGFTALDMVAPTI